MIITTNDLNNIETKITTPQIKGIEFINPILTDDGPDINASYNDIMAIIGAEKLPIIAFSEDQQKGFVFISDIFFDNPSYVVVLMNDNGTFTAENATTNMTIHYTTS